MFSNAADRVCCQQGEDVRLLISIALIFMMHVIIYSGSHLPIEVIVRLIHMWSVKTPVGKAQDELKVYISTVKVIKHIAYCR